MESIPKLPYYWFSIDNRSNSDCEMDLVLVIDFSRTTEPIYKRYMDLSQQLVSKLKIGKHYTRVALVLFASVGSTYTAFNLNKYDNASDVNQAISSAKYLGGTTAVGAFRLSIDGTKMNIGWTIAHCTQKIYGRVSRARNSCVALFRTNSGCNKVYLRGGVGYQLPTET
jgi:hypothetical protein